MDITPYVERLRHDLTQAAAAGSPEIRDAAERLALSLEPSVRLAMMEALSEATAEITSELRSGSVEVRLAGRELEFAVTHAAPPTPPTPPAPPTPPGDDAEESDGATARITLRLPEGVKTKAEELAAKGGHSLNTWIVNVVRAATREDAVTVDIDLSSLPFFDGAPFDPFGPGTGKRGPRRVIGWL